MKDHEDERITGLASFIPNFWLKEFTGCAERHILERILLKALFEKVVDTRRGRH